MPIIVPVFISVFCLYFFALDKVLLLIAFLTPLSVNLDSTQLGIAVSMPSEPMLLAFMLMVILKAIYDGKINRQVFRHPVTILILISFVWYFITCITSEIPLVSFKHFLARLWFVIPCYFVGITAFKNQKNINKYNWAYYLSFAAVIVYTLINHSLHGFSRTSGLYVMQPFFPEHTCYGAMLVFALPFLCFYAFDKCYPVKKRILAMGVLAIYLVGSYFSYTRAAWVSAVIAFGLYILFLLKIKFKHIIFVGVILAGLFFAFQDQIIMRLERNSQDSSQNFVEHIKSITNISSDASNLERINRWQSALRMYRERPVFGWGPGTYQFLYAPFQRSREKTIISTNAGDNGNAHSEYLGPLSEQGLPGLIINVLLYITIIATANKVYWKSKNRFDRLTAAYCMLALITYFIHGFLNNFLDIDKAAVMFWFYVAIIVSLDIKYRNENKQLQSDKENSPA